MKSIKRGHYLRVKILVLNFYLFMERERAHKQGKRQRERKGEADPR